MNVDAYKLEKLTEEFFLLNTKLTDKFVQQT